MTYFDTDRIIRLFLTAVLGTAVLYAVIVLREPSIIGSLGTGLGLALSWSFRGKQEVPTDEQTPAREVKVNNDWPTTNR